VINATFKPCEFLNGNNNNLVAKFIIDVFSKALPAGFVHKCPYQGNFTATNVTFENLPEFSSFLEGRYRAINRIFNSDDDNIMSSKFEFDLKKSKN
jgi:Protein of unknown function (DUF1091)